MRGFSQTSGNNKVPRDGLILWTETEGYWMFGAYKGCDDCSECNHDGCTYHEGLTK